MKMNSNIVRFVATAAFAASAFSASATTVTNSGSLGPLPVIIGQPINIPQFDPSLGTLNSVTVKTTARAGYTTFQVSNGDTIPVNATVSAWVNVNISGPAYSFIGTGGTNTIVTNILASSSVSFPITLPDATDSQVITAGASLALYTGLGTVPFPVSSFPNANVQGGAQLQTTPSPTSGADVVVIYDYTSNQECTPKGAGSVCFYTKPENWPAGLNSITVGCKTYTKAEVIKLLKKSHGSSDKLGPLLRQLIVAIINTDASLCNDHSCIDQTIADANALLCQYSGSKKKNCNKWISLTWAKKLEDYNLGRLCAPPRGGDDGCGCKSPRS